MDASGVIPSKARWKFKGALKEVTVGLQGVHISVSICQKNSLVGLVSDFEM